MEVWWWDEDGIKVKRAKTGANKQDFGNTSKQRSCRWVIILNVWYFTLMNLLGIGYSLINVILKCLTQYVDKSFIHCCEVQKKRKQICWDGWMADGVKSSSMLYLSAPPPLHSDTNIQLILHRTKCVGFRYREQKIIKHLITSVTVRDRLHW